MERITKDDLKRMLVRDYPLTCAFESTSLTCRVDDGLFCGLSSKGKSECGCWLPTDVYPERFDLAAQLLEAMEEIEHLKARLAEAEKEKSSE